MKNLLIFFLLALTTSGIISGCDEKDKPTTESEYDFELGWPTYQPWGAEMFCEENPDKCGEQE
jgi:hypothetical protein